MLTGEAERGQKKPAGRPVIADGEILGGCYEIERELGHGGWSVVYLARKVGEDDGSRVAIKVLRAGFDTEQHIARFEAEREVLMAAEHPSIAELFDSGTTEAGHPFIVMEWIDGAPITEFCKAQGFDVRDRLLLFQEVLEGIAHAHRCGIVHRDLKPGNILVTLREGQAVPKIIDFGIARMGPRPAELAALFTGKFQVVGTPAYMSPEQTLAGATEVDARSDLYSLGVVLYELLTGDLPCSEHRLRVVGPKELLRIIREEMIPLPSAQIGGKEIPRALDTLVLSVLEKSPADRHQNAESFSAAITKYLDRRSWFSRLAALWRPRKR